MASFCSSSPFISHSLTRPNHFSPSSSQTPPPPPPNLPPQPPHSPTPIQQLSTSSSEQPPTPVKEEQQKPSKTKTKADSTDWIASTLTRRFGIGAGLAWAAFLTVGVVSEQINKTRIEVSQQESNTRNVEKEEEVVLPNDIRYYELRVGGGATPWPGNLVVIDLKGKVEGSGLVFVDTFEREKKSLALVVGSRQPYSKGVCEGIEYVMRSMKSGGKRRVVVPPSLGFGENGADLGPGLQIPPSATLEYIIEVDRVSIAPA